MVALISNVEVENTLRVILEGQGYQLSPLLTHGATGVDTHKLSLRELYRSMDLPGANPIKDLHEELNGAVMRAYGSAEKNDVLGMLLDLNAAVAQREEAEKDVRGPSLPPYVSSKLISKDCAR